MIEIENNVLNDKWYLFFDTNTEEAYNLVKKEIASPDVKVRIRDMARRYHGANIGTLCIGVFKGDEARADGCLFKGMRVDNQTTGPDMEEPDIEHRRAYFDGQWFMDCSRYSTLVFCLNGDLVADTYELTGKHKAETFEEEAERAQLVASKIKEHFEGNVNVGFIEIEDLCL